MNQGAWAPPQGCLANPQVEARDPPSQSLRTKLTWKSNLGNKNLLFELLKNLVLHKVLNELYIFKLQGITQPLQKTSYQMFGTPPLPSCPMII